MFTVSRSRQLLGQIDGIGPIRAASVPRELKSHRFIRPIRRAVH